MFIILQFYLEVTGLFVHREICDINGAPCYHNCGHNLVYFAIWLEGYSCIQEELSRVAAVKYQEMTNLTLVTRWGWFLFLFIGGSLGSPQWLVLAFCPTILGGGGDLSIVVLLKKKYSFSGADNVKCEDTQTLLDGLKIELYTAIGAGDGKTF